MTNVAARSGGSHLRTNLLVVAVSIALAAGCSAGTNVPTANGPVATNLAATGSPGPSLPASGGTLRIVVPAGANTDLRDQPPTFLDPQLGGFGGLELWRCCLVRTLYSHNGRPTEDGGSRAYPDLASGQPDVSSDGRTWTIRIKPGIHYGPPLEGTEITAHDFVRSLERLLSPALAATSWWAWDFADIAGATDYQSGTAASITGLEAPDDHTLVIRLAQPKGDLPALLAEPAAGPLPPDPHDPDAALGIAQGADTGFGPFLVSSGPYMVEGSEKLDFSVAAAQRQAPAGETPGRLTLVRNPSWDSAADSLRPAYAARIEITLVDTIEQAVADIDAGTADLLWPMGGNVPTLPAAVVAAFEGNAARGRVHVNAGGAVRNAVLNVAVPPFDDVHVRRAINYAIDKGHLVDIEGGAVAARVFGHLLADNLEDGLLIDYDPYATPGSRGDLDAARAEMRQSRYDTNGDGKCDVASCRHVRAVTRDPYGEVSASIARDVAALGVDLEVDVEDTQTFLFETSQHPEQKIPLLLGIGFRANYIGGTGYLLEFDGRQSIDASTYNYTMVGATSEQLRAWGYPVTEVPNVDDRVEACVPLVGAAQFQCIASTDQYLMENVVPWVPYSEDVYVAITSPRVVTYGFDELAGTTALDQLALKQ